MSSRLVCLGVFLVPCFGALLAHGEDPQKPPVPPTVAAPLPGHSTHGEAFNEGPRQAAYLMQGMGRIKFPVTTASPEAQSFVNQGVAQLHGFWYFEAERSFRQAAMLDPKCAMCYWGLAMANTHNDKRAKEFAAEAVKHKAGVTERERLYIEALDAYVKFDANKKKERAEALIKNLEKIVYAAPDDLDAKAFLALQLWGSKEAGVPVQSYVAVDALLDQVFKAEPMHPAHHYRIHLWDGERAENALASAALSGQTSPGIAHMWHMGGHIFSDVKRYDAAAWQQEASARVDHAHMIRDRVLPDQIHNFAHNNEWLVRDLNYLGRAHDGASLAKNMIELPRHPQYNTLAKLGSGHYGRQRLIETLTKFELWDELLAACNSAYIEPTDDKIEQTKRSRSLATAHVRLGHLDDGRKILAELTSQLAQQKANAESAASDARMKMILEYRGDKEAEKAANDARTPLLVGSGELEKAIAEIEGHLAVASNDFKTGLAKLQQAGGVEATYLHKVRFLSGDKDPALADARKHAADSKNQVLPLAGLVELLWLADKKDEAAKSLEELRIVAAAADLDVPPLARLAPIAAERKLPADWRTPQPVPADAGVRPSLDSLGPFRWYPSPARPWNLPDENGASHSLADYHGRPVLVIFFLGHGCLHCAQQLQAFAPKLAEFCAAGIEIVAISSDDAAGLKKSIENYQPGKMPIPVLSDATLDSFKAYRAYDDFEKKALHGTFLIDGDGLVRWQDIGFEPFQDPTFALAEAKRLLAQPKPVVPSVPAATPMPTAQTP